MRNLLKFIIVISITLICALPTNAQKYNFGDFFYPFGCRSFISQNSEGKTESVSQFSFQSQSFNNFLVEEVYIGMGMLSSRTIYRYHTEDNTVISDVQFSQNALTGSSKKEDKITLFAFPHNDDRPYVWSETGRGDSILCKSEYVYVNFRDKRTKAIKITKKFYYTTNEAHTYRIKSYWIEGFGRIVTYYSFDDGEECVGSRIDIDSVFEEFDEFPAQGM